MRMGGATGQPGATDQPWNSRDDAHTGRKPVGPRQFAGEPDGQPVITQSWTVGRTPSLPVRSASARPPTAGDRAGVGGKQPMRVTEAATGVTEPPCPMLSPPRGSTDTLACLHASLDGKPGRSVSPAAVDTGGHAGVPVAENGRRAGGWPPPAYCAGLWRGQ